jgi:hypothetical protein
VVCTRTAHRSRPGARRAVVWAVAATLGAVRALAAQLAGQGIEKVTLESASGDWRIWFYVLEEAGLDVQLVSASQARQLSGRPKTGRLDARWLARLTGKGLLRPWFVPPAGIRGAAALHPGPHPPDPRPDPLLAAAGKAAPAPGTPRRCGR